MHDCISKRQHARSMRRGGAVSPEATGLDAPRAAQRQTRTWRHKGHSSAHKDGGERRQGPWGSGGSGGRDAHRNRHTQDRKKRREGRPMRLRDNPQNTTNAPCHGRAAAVGRSNHDYCGEGGCPCEERHGWIWGSGLSLFLTSSRKDYEKQGQGLRSL